MQTPLFDEVAKEVNTYINKAEDLTLVDIVNKVYNLNWEFFKYRNIVRAEGFDISRYSATRKFYKIYGNSTPEQIVDIYNYIHKTNYEFDRVCNVLREKKEEPVTT